MKCHLNKGEMFDGTIPAVLLWAYASLFENDTTNLIHLSTLAFSFVCFHFTTTSFFLSQGNVVKIDTITFIFHNLKSLEISTLFGYMEPILLLFSLLRSSPNLEKLKIEVMLNAIFWTFIIMFLKVILLLPTDFLYYFY